MLVRRVVFLDSIGSPTALRVQCYFKLLSARRDPINLFEICLEELLSEITFATILLSIGQCRAVECVVHFIDFQLVEVVARDCASGLPLH